MQLGPAATYGVESCTKRRSAGCDMKVLHSDGRHIEDACCRAAVTAARDGVVCYDVVPLRVQQLFV